MTFVHSPISPLAERLLNWYGRHARSLPWRGSSDPYTIWVSEIMLQQTRVETVTAYFKRWMDKYPSIHSLAMAPLQEVLITWEGLGYYSRARNLHRAAQIVVKEHAGRLPADFQALMKLPGIGRYTAGAIASIAYGLDFPVLDGNVRRVLTRVFDVSEEVGSSIGERMLWELAEQNLPRGKAGDYNQALMDLGAGICGVRSPRCDDCPLRDICQAKALAIQEERPVRKSRENIPHHTVTAAVIRRNGKLLITQRPESGLLGGMWEFPGGKLQPDEELDECLQREIREELGVSVQVGESVGIYQHAYTHFRVTLHAFRCALEGETMPRPLQVKAVRWIHLDELANYPMGKIDRQIANHIANENDYEGAEKDS